MGIYAIQLCQWVFELPPKTIKATGTLNEDGCDVAMSAKLIYGDNASATISTSALQELSNKAIIVGTKGTITVNYGQF